MWRIIDTVETVEEAVEGALVFDDSQVLVPVEAKIEEV